MTLFHAKGFTMHSTRFSLAASAFLIGAVGANSYAADKTLYEQAPPEQKALFDRAKPKIIAEAKEPGKILGKTGEEYFWVMSARMLPLLKAYRYTHDPEYLELYVPIQEQILSQRYIHPTKPEYNGWYEYDAKGDKMFQHVALIDHDTILYFVPVLMFVQEVRADPALKEKYGGKAEAWLKDVEASIRAWDKRGCYQDFPDGSGWYHSMTVYPDPKTGELKKLDSIGAGGTVPYNKVHALFEALTLAYRITGDPWYTTRMEKCSKFFKKHVEWNYRDHAFPGDYKSGVLGQGEALTGAFVHPKGGYYQLDAEGITNAYDLNIVYTKEDIEKLLKTNLEFMFTGDATDPKFKKIDGTVDKSGKYNYIGRLWTALAHFSPKTRELWKAQIDKNGGKGWMSWGDELDYLLEVSQPVSWDRRYVPAASK